MNTNILTSITSIITALGGAAANPSVIGSLFGNLLHTQTNLAGLNMKDKTMTTTFVQNNAAMAVGLEAQGFTVVIG